MTALAFSAGSISRTKASHTKLAKPSWSGSSRPVDLIGAGRTDAGVHARAMVASVHLDVAPVPGGASGLYESLPSRRHRRPGVKEALRRRFHARYNALGKTYRYTCFIGPVKPVFDRKYVTLLDFSPDIEDAPCGLFCRASTISGPFAAIPG